MKPYEIEIFDRQFNFKFNALIDEADFSYKFDAISPEKNSIAISKDFKPSQLSTDVNAPKGWLIRILSDNKEYQGVISGFEKGEKNNTIEYLQPVEIFNITIPMNPKDGVNVVMETFIKNILTANFVNSMDSYQNIANLQIPTPTTSTTGTFQFATSESDRENVNIVDDILVYALSNGVATNVSFNFSSKTVTANIVKSSNAITIESHLPNIIDKSFIIRKATKEVNRADIFDTYLETEYQYYLHTDYTHDRVNNNRLLPIYNSVSSFNGYEIAQAIIDQTILDNIQSASTVIFYNGNVPYALYPELNAINLGNDLLQKENWFEDRLEEFAEGDDTTPPYMYLKFNVEYEDAKSGAEYNYRGINPGDLDYTPWRYYYEKSRGAYQHEGQVFDYTCTFSNFRLASKDYHLADYIDEHGTVSNAHYSYGRVVRLAESIDQGTGWRTTIQDLLDNFSHIIIQENYIYNVHTNIKWYNPGETMIIDEYNEDFTTTLMCMIPITYDDVVWGLSAYAGSSEYVEDIIALTPSASQAQAALLAQAAFASNKYTNLIEITTKTGDTMINPLSLNIGQAANLIQDDVSYNSILTGYEIKSELIKLIFGTIRLDLTKLLRERS